MNPSLGAYAARTAVDWDRRAAGAWWISVEGTLAKVDLSGFTRLSERLARSDVTGAEGLNTVLNDVFAELVEEVLDRGGDVLQFGGDALLIWFEGAEHQARAVAACMAMQQRMRERAAERTAAGPVRLRMSAGVASGSAVLTVLGKDHRELFALGPVASRVELLEKHADSGQVLVDETTAAFLPPGAARPADPDAWRCVRRPPEVSARRTPQAGEGAEGFVPPDVRDVEAVGVPMAEHRRASVAFVGLTGLDALVETGDVDQAVARVKRVADAVDEAVEATRVAWTATDLMHDGAVFLLYAGAPIAREDDEERMLRACRLLVGRCADLGVRAGVHAGRVFAADIGHPDRRTYAVIGDTTNLAARLMHRAAPGTVLVTEDVFDRSERDHVVTDWQQVSVKGRTRSVRVGVLGERTESTLRRRTHDLPLIGRSSERQQLSAVLTALSASQHLSAMPLSVALVAEAGTGKSRLVEDMVGAARERGMVVLHAAGSTFETDNPYGTLRHALRAALGVGDDPAAVRDRLAGLAPRSADLVPLLGLPLGVDLGTTPRVEALDPRFVASRRNALLADVLLAACRGPQVVVVEDLHDLDRASAGLLEALAQRAAPGVLAVVVSGRVPLTEVFEDTERWTVIALGPLTPDEARQLALAAAGDQAVSDADLDAMVGDSGGNPLFLRELVALSPSAGGALPASAEEVIAARIDTLGPARRRLLRDTSVGGPRQRLADLAAVLEDPTVSDGHSWVALSDFVTVLRASDAAPLSDTSAVLFRHDLYREAAYAGLAVRRRRELHGRFADHLIATATGDAPTVAVHLHEAQRYEEAWEWTLRAARAARDGGALHDAAPLFARAADAGERAAVADEHLAAVREELGDVCELVGRYDEADAAFRAAARAGPAHDVVRRMVKRAAVHDRQGRYRAALSLLTRAERRLQQDSAIPGDGRPGCTPSPVWTALALRRSSVLHRLGRPTAAYRVASEVASATQAATDPELRVDHARALLRLEMISSEAGWPERFDLGARALAAFDGLDADRDLASLLGNMGVTAWESDDWSRAAELYEEAVAVYRRAGDVVGAAIAANNAGEILCEQGRLLQATEVFETARRIFRAAGHEFGIACTASALGRVAARTGEHARAAALLDEAHTRLDAMGSTVFAADARVRQVEAALLSDDPDALASAASLVDELEHTDVGVVLPLTARRYLAVALAKVGKLAEAERVAQEARERAAAANVAYEESLALDLLVGLAVMTGSEPEPDAVRRRDLLWQRLGVVDAPAYPPVPRVP